MENKRRTGGVRKQRQKRGGFNSPLWRHWKVSLLGGHLENANHADLEEAVNDAVEEGVSNVDDDIDLGGLVCAAPSGIRSRRRNNQ